MLKGVFDDLVKLEGLVAQMLPGWTQVDPSRVLESWNG